MRYALLIYVEPWEPTDEENAETMRAYNAFTQEAVDAGVMRGGEALEDAKTATSVRVRNGQTVVTDGPFAETKELIGGYAILRADSREEAIAMANRVLDVHASAQVAETEIEIRPLFHAMNFDNRR